MAVLDQAVKQADERHAELAKYVKIADQGPINWEQVKKQGDTVDYKIPRREWEEFAVACGKAGGETETVYDN